jgi:hypothetical protein
MGGRILEMSNITTMADYSFNPYETKFKLVCRLIIENHQLLSGDGRTTVLSDETTSRTEKFAVRVAVHVHILSHLVFRDPPSLKVSQEVGPPIFFWTL